MSNLVNRPCPTCGRHPLKEQQDATDAAEIARLRAEVSKRDDAYVKLQQHRDAWRMYAYDRGEKPSDFLDGNMVDRPQTLVERLQAVVDDLKKLMAESRGVDGLHLNGDVAEWDWLINNGWLDSLRPRDSEEAHDAG